MGVSLHQLFFLCNQKEGDDGGRNVCRDIKSDCHSTGDAPVSLLTGVRTRMRMHVCVCVPLLLS